MLQKILIELYQRDLDTLKGEIEAFVDDEDVWRTGGTVKNSAGNLALHIIGNLKHFIGAVLGGSGYVRNRDEEFASTGVPRQELLSAIGEARAVVTETLGSLSDEDLGKDFPVELFDRTNKTAFILIHLAMHLDYHLGQINYHRRWLGVRSTVE